MDEHLARLLEADERARRDREERRVAFERRKAAEQEYDQAWDAVIRCCITGDKDASLMPDLSPFLKLAEVLAARGWHEWLPSMSENFDSELDSMWQERRDQQFIVTLLREASKPAATVEKLQAIYASRKEGQRSLSWRAAAAGEVKYYFLLRIPHVNDAPTRTVADVKKLQEQRPVEIKKKNYALAMGWSGRKMTNMVKSGKVPICRPASKHAQLIVVDLLQVPTERREAVLSKAQRDT